MDRRTLLASGLATAGLSGVSSALAQPPPPGVRDPFADRAPAPPQDYPPAPPAPQDYAPPPGPGPDPSGRRAPTFDRTEIVNATSDFLGVTAEAAGGAIERIFRDNGQPTGYVAGEEFSGAFAVGLRYGRGLLYMKGRPTLEVWWQGPSVGWDVGGNASRVFTLCYDLQYPDAIFRRFPGVEGSAYVVGGMGVNYQRADGIILAPVRAGVGLRLGANVGYLSYSRNRNLWPF